MIPILANIPSDLGLLAGSDTYLILFFLIDLVFFVVIANFFKFHVTLVLLNRTTIESLELKKTNQTIEDTQSPYNFGEYKNWVQVFGKNKILWFFPMFGESGKPMGDGVKWQEEAFPVSGQNT